MSYQFAQGTGPTIIVTGNPVDGFRHVGPFDTPSAAIDWATSNVTEEWWETQLETKEGYANGPG